MSSGIRRQHSRAGRRSGMRCGLRPAPLRATTTCWLRPSSTGPASHCRTVTHISTVEDVVDTSLCFTPHEVPLGGRYVGHAVDDYHLKNFNSLFPNPLELLKLRSSAVVLVFCASFDMREVLFSF